MIRPIVRWIRGTADSTVRSSRFASPTRDLDLDHLLVRARKALWIALGGAVVVHLVIVGVNPFEQALEKRPRPLTTRFVKREPRLTKPLELRKIPQPKRELIRRQVRLAEARMDQVQATAVFDTRGLLGQAAVTSASLAQEMPTAALDLEPALMSSAIEGTRQPANKIDMSLEMLDVSSMDTGRYRAMVVQDPSNPQALKGFVKIARVQREINETGNHTAQYNNMTMIYLVQALRQYTDLKVDFLDHLSVADDRLLKTPMIIITGHAPYGKPGTEQEMEQLARYVMEGGFIFGSLPPTEALEKYGELVQGRDYYSDRVPENHPIYNCFFDIGSAPIVNDGYATQGPTRNDLQATWIGDRMVAFTISPFWISRARLHGKDTTRYLQLAVNTVVYALTQEGSMTQRLMQMVQ